MLPKIGKGLFHDKPLSFCNISSSSALLAVGFTLSCFLMYFNWTFWYHRRMKIVHYGSLEPCLLVWSRSIPLQSHLTNHGMCWDLDIIQALAGMRSAMLQLCTSMETWSHGSILPWANSNPFGQNMSTLRMSTSKPAASVYRLDLFR